MGCLGRSMLSVMSVSQLMSMNLQRSISGEEIASSLSQGAGLVAAIIALPVLIESAVERGGTAEVIGAIVFATTMILLFAASTLYHGLPAGRAKQVRRVLDHSAIYLFIAGSYTPFTLGVLSAE
jgi:hemolysin III